MTLWAWLLVAWGIVLVAFVAFFVATWRHQHRYGPTSITVPDAHFVPSDEGKLVGGLGPDPMVVSRVVSATTIVIAKAPPPKRDRWWRRWLR